MPAPSPTSPEPDPPPAPKASQPGPTLPSGASPVGNESARSPSTLGLAPGDRVGPYKLIEVIGEGGFGVVWLAERREPMVQRVALKIIKPGMDSASVVARFDQERQALAVMDHPNVAKVFDGGVTDRGLPYFVMEHVKGEPITVFADRHRLTIRQRLELFLPVCEAVQHAHMKGIIHRDLKPSNVLVETVDGKPIVKVIDFGIAKATDASAVQHSVFSMEGQLIGTPEYMSPEQAGGQADIDTRTDVYVLGVTLCELLVGVLPFDPALLRRRGFEEILRIIRDEEPPKPSTRLSAAREMAEQIASARRESQGSIVRTLRRELEWIPLKAMRKERDRRYESAAALPDDIRRYLEGRALRAAPESRAYLARKFVRRNRVLVGAAGAVFVALSAGLAGTAWQAREAARQRDAAVLAGQKEAQQRVEAEQQRARADERAIAAQTAEKAAEAARDAEKDRADQLKKVSDFQSQMLAQIDMTKAGMDLMADVRERFVAALEESGVPEADRTTRVDALRQELVRVNATDAAAAMIDRTILKPAIKTIDERFKDDPATDASLRQALADLYVRIGLYDAAFPLQESALATRRRVLGEEHPDTLTSINNMGQLLEAQGRLDQAEPYFREALEKRRRVLGEEHPETLISISSMGSLLWSQGKLDQAEPYYREDLEKSRRVLGEEHPNTLVSINNMGGLLRAQGRLDQAEPYFREALEKRRRVLGEEHPDTLGSINNMGVLLRDQGKLDQAEPYFREALEKSRRVLGEEHPDTLQSINNMGFLLRDQGKLDQAEPYWREALEKSRRVLGEEHPDTLGSVSLMGRLKLDQNKAREALDLITPYEPAARKKFTGGNARRLADFLTGFGRARVGVGYDAEGFKLAEANLLEAHPIYLAAKGFGPTHKDTLECVQGLVDLYTAWDKAEPGKGYDAKAAEWKAKLPPPAPPAPAAIPSAPAPAAPSAPTTPAAPAPAAPTPPQPAPPAAPGDGQGQPK